MPPPSWCPTRARAVKGNVVHMDFEGLLDGVAFQGGTAQNSPCSWAAAV